MKLHVRSGGHRLAPDKRSKGARRFCLCVGSLTFVSCVLLLCHSPEAEPHTTLLKGSQEVTNDKTPEDIKEESGPERKPDLSCTCYNSTASRKCCERLYLAHHKFGYELSHKLFGPFEGLTYARLDVAGKKLRRSLTASDYRHVAFGRNVYDAIVSGYLYHRNGNECWLDKNGIPAYFRFRFLIDEWTPYISLSQPYPTPGNRSLCGYLADESEEYGMRVYISVAVKSYYAPVLRYWRNVENRIKQGENKTLRVCLEDVGDPAKQTNEFQRMMDWLYPGGHNYEIPFRPQAYTGGHATPTDETLRNKLKSLVKRMDDDIFNRSLAKIQAGVQCPD